MGNIIMATCPCGLESKEILQGIGFNYYENHQRMEPAYCDHCGIVAGRDMSKSISKCPKCRRKMRYYFEDLEMDSGNEEDFPDSEYLESKEFWHCPRCKQETLKFEGMGCWD
jgi:predicted Zn-ribbon and HTH transcriptional regulator